MVSIREFHRNSPFFGLIKQKWHRKQTKTGSVLCPDALHTQADWYFSAGPLNWNYVFLSRFSRAVMFSFDDSRLYYFWCYFGYPYSQPVLCPSSKLIIIKKLSFPISDIDRLYIYLFSEPFSRLRNRLMFQQIYLRLNRSI